MKALLNTLYDILRKSRDARIHDVALESDGEEIILDTDDGKVVRRWVISDGGILETDADDLPILCKRCSGEINGNGYCEDETCPHSDRKQDETWTEE
jgi:hypothetical protein